MASLRPRCWVLAPAAYRGASVGGSRDRLVSSGGIATPRHREASMHRPFRPRAARDRRAADRSAVRAIAVPPAVAGRRRDRHGQHARPRHLEALRAASRQSEGEVLRAVLRALQHHAAVAVRDAAAARTPSRRSACRVAPRLQHRRGRERRSRPAGHADGCARPFRGAAAGLGRQGRVSRRPARNTTAASRRSR